jgi:hypothetical protein
MTQYRLCDSNSHIYFEYRYGHLVCQTDSEGHPLRDSAGVIVAGVKDGPYASAPSDLYTVQPYNGEPPYTCPASGLMAVEDRANLA